MSINYLRHTRRGRLVFEMDSTVSIAGIFCDIRYEVTAWLLDIPRESWDYEIALIEVGQCPVSWLTKEAQKLVRNAITDDIHSEIEERR